MWTTIVTVGPLLAGLSALFALGLSLTKTALLRRREESLRSIKDSLEEGSRHHKAIELQHRKMVAALVSRQVMGVWRFMRPWLVFLVTSLVCGQSGYYLGRYIEEGGPFSLERFSAEVFGGDVGAIFLAPVGVLLLGGVFLHYEHSLFQRARTTRDFFNTGAIYPRPANPDVMREPERRRMKTAWWYLRLVTPGLCSIAVGLAVGIQVYIRVESDAGLDSEGLVRTGFWTSIVAVLLVAAVGFIAADVREYRRDIELLPRPRVPKEVRRHRALVQLGLAPTRSIPRRR